MYYGRIAMRLMVKILSVIKIAFPACIVACAGAVVATDIHFSEATMHERIGAEKQKRRNFVSTHFYRKEVESLQAENRNLKRLMSENQRLRARIAKLQSRLNRNLAVR